MPNHLRFLVLLVIVVVAVGASVFLVSGTLMASDTSSVTVSSGDAEGGMPGVSEGSEGSGGALPSYPGEETPALPPQIAEDIPACDFKNYIGLPVDKLDQKAIFGDRPVRVITPDMAVTMDYSAARINIMIDKTTRKITDITCG